MSAASFMATFQSTLPRGSDSEDIKKVIIFLYFNPRSLAGATNNSSHFQSASRYFNPRSLAGATKIKLAFSAAFVYFNPRSLAGATLFLLLSEVYIHISIHAPSRERHENGIFVIKSEGFQSTLPRGSDYNKVSLLHLIIYFNPRSLAGATASKQITSLFI